jgi:uncharacterized protein YjeT (DUF2065 family)
MPERGLEFFLCVIGMVMIIEGMPYFAAPEMMKDVIRRLGEQGDLTLRVLGGVLVLTGLAVVFYARKGVGGP